MAESPPTRPAPIALVVAAAALLAVWSPLIVDGVRVVARGAPPHTLALLHGLSLPLGLAFAVGVGLVAAVGAGVGWVVARGLERLWGARLPPSRWATALVALLAVPPLHAAHLTMVKHPLVAVLFSGYAAVSLTLVAWSFDRVRPALVPRPLVTAGLGLVAGVGLHAVNATAYVNLYPELHRALTAVTVLVWLGAWVTLLLGRSLRGVLGLGAAVAASGGLAAAAGGDLDRSPLAFSGTESRHAFELLDAYLDGDGDGLAGAPVGVDCDDGDPAVHPLQFEVAGNGRDDNCRLGDAPPGAPAPLLRPAVPPSPGAAAWRAAHPSPDVVLIFLDTVRADALGRGDSPRIDAFAAEAVRFTHARSTVGRTPHAWMSLVRGRFLERVLDCRRSLHAPGTQTLIHRMQAGGWRTIGRLVGRSWPRYHLDGGWSTLTMRGHVKRQTGADVATDVVRALDRREPGPRLVVAHFADPHAPYRGADGRAHPGPISEGYRAEIAFTDAQVGRVLDALGDRPTLVVMFADHGENLGERGQGGGHHGGSVFDEVLRVPLMIRAPGIAPRAVDAPVSLVDIAPTVLELTGQHPLSGADGRSLAGLVFGDGPPPGPVISGFFDFGHRLRSIADDRFKLVVDARRGARLLFDVIDDPGETRDVGDEHPEALSRLQGLLDGWIEHEADPLQRGRRCKDLAVGR